MQQVLLQSGSLFGIIILGYLLKRWHILTKKDGDVLSRMIVYVTLPAAIIVNLSDLRIQNQLLLFIVVALIWSIFQVLLAYFTTFKQENKQKATMMYLGSGFNIGNFLLPFIQNIQPAFVPMISMFDIGNSIMLTGGTQAVVDTLVATNQRFSFRNMLRQLLSSIPFMCYLIMFGLRYFQVSLPSFIHTFFVPLANANVFLSMFMIGLYLDFSLPKGGFKALVKLFSLRYLVGFLLIFVIHILPISMAEKMVISLLCVSPIPLFGVMNAVIVGAKEGYVGFASSLSFLFSLVFMTLIVLVMN